jgi:nucleotide-binding universal stress UspA family protein
MTRPIRTVVIGTSLTEVSDHVVRSGVAVARAAGARVHLVHAYVFPAQYYGDYVTGQVWADAQLLDEHEAWRQERLADQVKRLGIADAELDGMTVGLGASHRLVIDVAQDHAADLIVVGATEHGRSARLLGSTADRVIRQAMCPVLVIRDDLRVPPRRVLAPVDMSELSKEAFARGMSVLAQLGGRPEVQGLFVLHPTHRGLAPQSTADSMEPHAREELEAFLAPWRAHGPVVGTVRTGHPHAVIVAEAADPAVDLVVMGTHGRSGYERFLIGSVTMEVVRDARCSVLAIPPAAAHAGLDDNDPGQGAAGRAPVEDPGQ